MIETYKILTGKYDRDVTEGLFKLRGDSDTRGHSLKIFKERPRLDCRKYSFTYRVADPWNSLTENIIQAPTVSAFERRLDKHWKNQGLMYNFRAPPIPRTCAINKVINNTKFYQRAGTRGPIGPRSARSGSVSESVSRLGAW